MKNGYKAETTPFFVFERRDYVIYGKSRFNG